MLTDESFHPYVVPPDPVDEAPTIPVRVVSRALRGHEPVRLYAELVDRFGPDEVFLVESLAGPERERRGATVGWGRLAAVRLYADRVELDGVPALRPRLARLAADAGLRPAAGLWWFDRPESVWELLRGVQRLFDVRTDLPGTGYAFGFLLTVGYEAAWHMERLPDRRVGDDSGPDLELVLFQHAAVFDAGGGARHQHAESDLFPPAERLPDGTAPGTGVDAVPAAPDPLEVTDNVDRATFLNWVRRCLRHIGVGDVYQIQVGHRIDVRSALTPLDVYRRLRWRNPSPHMYLVPHGGRTLIGASPELLFRIEGETVLMRPIAGTTRRDGSPADEERVRALRDSTKEQAEHIMLVDLCRNDVSRVASPHSLAVDRLMTVETFSHVFHLVSTVSARLAPEADVWSTLRATFPAGTMTGAPKVRAMELIAETEHDERGMYAGAVGLVDARGWSELALCIRTVIFDGVRYSAQSSAGVVALSEPDGEWAETLAKLGSAYWALTDRELVP
ncbi:anthranilate synthase component I family protein [Plantactinospora endophytica]|uniref:Anthranilate synthase component I family protein n=1 Tax=Plantactinospora endophytica TaxID=673535 RepID=A0ABQ4E7Z6_9ACTN|nr:anthranilate synthase component I family protein [Plantactinospora endophytica]GIG90421.1 hypothetical protein Pen02_53570 [Plantactinospora endophytica]